MILLKRIFLFVIVLFGISFILVTAISLVYNSGFWFLRVLNFPRLEVLIGLLVCLFFYLLFRPAKSIRFYVFLVALLAAVAVQGYILYPYTALSHKAVPSADINTVDKSSLFSIIVVNVLMYNRQSQSLLAIVKQKEPTFLLTMEVNPWWVKQMDGLKSVYPYQILFPTGNTYGMCLYSKLPLQNSQVLFLNHDSVPFFHTAVMLPNGAAFRLFTIHPVAPKPSEHPDNMNRKEVALPKAAAIIASSSMPALAAGDFNDVGWSHNMEVFQQTTGLNDLRIGRGFYNTFDATSSLMRWPLDYIFVSHQFKVLAVERLHAFGSDHFPYYAQLSLAP